VRVAQYQFFSDACGHVINREIPFLFCDRRMKDHLKHQIAQFFAQV
jgi:hypothetical protein